jgi:hypothetical protein
MSPLSLDPTTSEEAKKHAREVLAAAGVDVGDESSAAPSAKHDQHETHVLAGYKATLHSESGICPKARDGLVDGDLCTDPKTSEEAKTHAREILEKKSAL